MDYNNNSDYDENGKKIVRTTEIRRERLDNNNRVGEDYPAKSAGTGIGAIVIIALLALAAWFFFFNKHHDANTVDGKAGNGDLIDKTKAGAAHLGDKVKDVAAEVPQAAKDATKKGDQDTTRPNKDNSKIKLDQK